MIDVGIATESMRTAIETLKRPVRVLLTACGSPGSATMIRQLQKHGCYVIGVDMNPEAVGRWLASEFYVVPAANCEEYMAFLFVAAYGSADVCLPQSSTEVPVIAEDLERRSVPFPCPVLVSKPEPMRLATNKAEMYLWLTGTTHVPLPKLQYLNGTGATDTAIKVLQMALDEWGACVIKPCVGKGSRGVRIIDPSVSMRDVIDGKPGASKYATLSQIEEAYKDDFPEMLVMEKLEGEEIAVDVLCQDGEVLLYCARTVETQRSGVVMTGEIVDRPEIIEQVKAILKAIPLDYCVNLQFIGGKLIEINPRVSTFIYQDDLCMPWLAIQLALGELDPDGVRAYQGRVQIGRRMVRYMDQVFYAG